MSLWSILERARRLHPDRPAVGDDGHALSYASVGARIDALAHRMIELGLRPGDRVAALLPNGLAYLESYFAAAGAGLILVPLNIRLTASELGFILRDSGSTVILADSALAPLTEAAIAEAPDVGHVLWAGGTPAVSMGATGAAWPEPGGPPFVPVVTPMDHVAHLYYTSGTTGPPKGVMLTHRNVWVHALAAIAELELRETDVWGHIAPMFHLADAWATFAITWVGGRHLMVPRFEPGEVLATLERENVTITNLVPTMLNLMVKHPTATERRFPRLRRILSGGAPIAPAVVEAIINVFGCEYVQTYGMTETSPYLTLSLLKDHLRALPPAERLRYQAKTGRPFVAIELRVVDDAGAPVAADECAVGEIQVRGETVTPGYWRRPDATTAAFTPDGWLRTGDLAVLDSEGYVSIVDRKKDMIITGGEKVYSTEVEAVLYQHPGILEAAVFGSPDAIWGEVVNAAVVLRDGARLTAEEVTDFCRPKLAGFKLPRQVRFLPELPKTGSGKILKRALAG